MLGLEDLDAKSKAAKKRKSLSVTFNEEEQVINMEDIDPSIGRFRNLVQSTVVPVKRMKTNSGDSLSMDTSSSGTFASQMHRQTFMAASAGLYSDLPAEQHPHASNFGLFSSTLGSKLGIALPNPAPDVDMEVAQPTVQTTFTPKDFHPPDVMEEDTGPKKKKYAKEAWPGRKPHNVPSLI
jgi:nuclear inhibitor of protein phosphatase 1